jgi:hypothetical protein
MVPLGHRGAQFENRYSRKSLFNKVIIDKIIELNYNIDFKFLNLILQRKTLAGKS